MLCVVNKGKGYNVEWDGSREKQILVAYERRFSFGC